MLAVIDVLGGRSWLAASTRHKGVEEGESIEEHGDVREGYG